MKMEKKIQLPGGGRVSVDEDRVRVDLPCSYKSVHALSSAIHNGGHRTLFATTTGSGSSTRVDGSVSYLNYRVAPTYNGYDPSPAALLSGFIGKQGEGMHADSTVGLLTAASMETLSVASRGARGVCVDAVVTSGLSNSRAAGADADWFGIVTEEVEADKGAAPPGTINTLVVVNTALTEAARVEAYAIAIEAKCRACVDHDVACAKDATALAQGTGTDCCVLLCPSSTGPATEPKGKDRTGKGAGIIEHAGKHTLFAELIGQAVYDATSQSIMCNIRHSHGHYSAYKISRLFRAFLKVMQGARPCIPPYPMMPIPSAPFSVVVLGACSVLSAYYLGRTTLVPPGKARLLLAAAAWDRYLGEPPLVVHPVCLAGSAISAVLSRVPSGVYKRPLLGLGCGSMLLAFMLAAFVPAAGLFLRSINVAVECVSFPSSDSSLPGSTLFLGAFKLSAWILELLLLKSTFSLQLLCTIPLQMSGFLERGQLNEARMQLSWLCSRDPSELGPAELAGGTLESLSENLSDGFVAPLFWYVLLGPLGSLAYRVINTLDSRIGYRGKFEWFGKPSARLDDVVNFIPARITALLLAMAAWFIPRCCSPGRGLATAWRDQSQCESPNAGWPMACFAGLLGVRLEKKGAYSLGTGPEPTPDNIRTGTRIVWLAGAMTLLFAAMACAIIE